MQFFRRESTGQGNVVCVSGEGSEACGRNKGASFESGKAFLAHGAGELSRSISTKIHEDHAVFRTDTAWCLLWVMQSGGLDEFVVFFTVVCGLQGKGGALCMKRCLPTGQ